MGLLRMVGFENRRSSVEGEVWRCSAVFQGETQLQRHLPVGYPALFNVTPGVDDLEPAKISHCFRRLPDGPLNRVLHAFGRGAYQLDRLVHMLRHGCSEESGLLT